MLSTQYKEKKSYEIIVSELLEINFLKMHFASVTDALNF